MTNLSSKCKDCVNFKIKKNNIYCCRCNDVNNSNNQENDTPKKIKKELKVQLDEHVHKMEPFNLNDLFKWIFDQQIYAMQSFVRDHSTFKKYANILWEEYIKVTGAKFDITQKSMDEIKNNKYPLGWGATLDPKRVEETLIIVPRNYNKLKRKHLDIEIEGDGSNDDSDHSKNKHITKENVKKIKIKKMVVEKFNNKYATLKESLNVNKKDIKNFKKNSKKKIDSGSNTADCSVDTLDINDKERDVVRILGEKRDCHLRYIGGRVRTEQLFMENNLLLLFFGVYLSGQATRQCCCLLDILRLAKHGVIPFIKVTKILPVDRFFLQHTVFQSFVLRDVMPSFNDMKHYAFYLAETLDLAQLLKPNTDILVVRFLSELNLPRDLFDLISFLREMVDEKLNKYFNVNKLSGIIEVNSKWTRFKTNGQHILVPELSCLAYIFLAMRVMMRFNGVFEKEVSKLSQEFNTSNLCGPDAMNCERVFVWSDWVKQEFRPLTISGAKTWEDLGRVKSAKMFFEEDYVCKNGVNDNVGSIIDCNKSGGDNDFVNMCGRFVQPYVICSYDSVIRGILRPLESLVSRMEESHSIMSSIVDYRENIVDHLLHEIIFKSHLEKKFQINPSNDQENKSEIGRNSEQRKTERDASSAQVKKIQRGISSGQESNGWMAVNKLISLCQKNPLGLSKLGNEHQRYPIGVLEESLSVNRMTQAESNLLGILVRDTDISVDILCDTANSLNKILLKNIIDYDDKKSKENPTKKRSKIVNEKLDKELSKNPNNYLNKKLLKNVKENLSKKVSKNLSEKENDNCEDE